jgi:hydrogenase expression/formation protein HypE
MTDPAHVGRRILLGHGSGGKLYRDLVRDVFVAAFSNATLDRLEDAAVLSASGRIAMTTDAHVVQPLRFPGGDIGRLAVAGTVNDLATAGARPLGMAAAFVIEEGFLFDDLIEYCGSMAATAAEAGVAIVTGDTKVVQRGAADGMFITTTGVGELVVEHDVSAAAVREGDVLIVSGSVGDHALAVVAARGEFHFETTLESDCAPLWGMVEAALAAGGPELRFMRDPTRGGLATVLAELAESTGLGIDAEEEAIPVQPAVRSVCDLLGYDPLSLANEGKMLFAVGPDKADAVVGALRGRPEGALAAPIGRVVAAHPGRVALRTVFGTRRVLDMPVGELLPRIC